MACRKGGPPAADVREPGPVIYHIERCVMRDSTLSPPAGAPRHNSDGCADERAPPGGLDLGTWTCRRPLRRPRRGSPESHAGLDGRAMPAIPAIAAADALRTELPVGTACQIPDKRASSPDGRL